MGLSRCRHRSLFNFGRWTVSVRGFRIHHGYVGAALFGTASLLEALKLGSFGTLQVSGGAMGLDDAIAHLRNWVKGERD